jgi:hypothetical protein
MYVSQDCTKVELEYYQRDRKTLLLESIDSTFEDGSLVQFTFKTRDPSSGTKKKFNKKILTIIPKN